MKYKIILDLVKPRLRRISFILTISVILALVFSGRLDFRKYGKLGKEKFLEMDEVYLAARNNKLVKTSNKNQDASQYFKEWCASKQYAETACSREVAEYHRIKKKLSAEDADFY